MFDKYEVKSYPDYLQIEESDSNTENGKSTLKSKKTYYMNSNKNTDNSYQPECIIIRNNNNTAFFQSDSKNSYRSKKNLTQNKMQGRYNFSNRKSLPPQNYIEEKFSYNYTNEENNKKRIKSNKISPLNQRVYIDVDPFLNETNKELPRRTIKSIQNQFDIERSENFKVLSYRPEDYESNSKMDGKSKIIQIFKKQDVDELFFPSKRSLSPPSTAHSSDKRQQKLLSYQTPTLKFQSFFGSFTKSKHSKNNSQTKPNGKLKNQLEEFNIDKLIEIGDNYAKKYIPILSFGKKVKSIKNKMKKRSNLNKNKFEMQKSCDKIRNHMKDERNENKKLIDITKIYEQKRKSMYKSNNKTNYNSNMNNMNSNINYNINDNINKDINWKRMSANKNIVYHGQIKRKRNFLKNTKSFNSNEKNKYLVQKNENNKENPNINQNLNININNELNNNNNYKKIILSKVKKKTVKPNHKVIEYFHNNINKPNENQVYQQKTPKKVIQNNRVDVTISNNNNNNYSVYNKINNYPNLNNIFERNKIINNCKMIDNKNSPQGEISKKVLLTEQEVIHYNKIIEENKNIKKEGNEEENYKNKKYTKINNNANVNNQISKRISDKNFKSKNYYGYDDVNNIEGAINNHSYFESVYSNKKGQQKNISIDKNKQIVY